ncbi:MAG: hypothetical protein P4M05_28295 [Bradyrhizobium sp.]|nr:hypothetical protein [Bradyrhizobium sp.]
MDPIEFKRLVENVRIDGKLTSMPLVYQHDDGSLELLSGHHRTEAAIAAPLDLIWVEVILTRCDEARLTALQLSHNAISGKDNPGLLAELYASLDLAAKKFSGLTDNVLQDLVQLDLSALAGAAITYQELIISFLPEDKEVFRVELERFTEKAKKNQPERWIARLADFDRVFDAVVKTKHETGIVNAAMAILAMAEFAMERLEQLEAARAEHDRDREQAEP